MENTNKGLNNTMKQMGNVMKNPNQLFSTKNVIIFVLVFLLILSFLGINILVYVGRLLELLVNIIRPLFDNILSFIFYYIGLAINVSADVTADVARTGIDIAEGTAHSVGNLLQNEDNVDGPLLQENPYYRQLFESKMLAQQTYPYTLEQNARAHEHTSEVLKTTADMAEMIMSESSMPLNINVTEANPSSPTGTTTTKDLDKTIQKEKHHSDSSGQPHQAYCFVGEFDGKRTCVSMDSNELCESGKEYPSEKECTDKPVVQMKQPLAKNWGMMPPVPPKAAYSPPLGNYLPQNKYVATMPKYVQSNVYPNMMYANMMNPYYASDYYRMNQPSTMGPQPGLYFQKPQ